MSGLKALRESDGEGFYVAFSPEREDPGNVTVARCDIPKVIGGYGEVAKEMACAVYQIIFRQTVTVSSTFME